jgi:hypothetical protein
MHADFIHKILEGCATQVLIIFETWLPAHIDLPDIDLLTKSTANQEVIIALLRTVEFMGKVCQLLLQ